MSIVQNFKMSDMQAGELNLERLSDSIRQLEKDIQQVRSSLRGTVLLHCLEMKLLMITIVKPALNLSRAPLYLHSLPLDRVTARPC